MQIRKTPPQVSDPEVNQAIQQIYLDVNTLSEQKAESATSLTTENSPSGSVRAVKQADNTYIVSIKTDDGWVQSQPGHFTFQDKKG